MSEEQIIQLLLTGLENYGPGALGLIMLTSAIGIPWPVTPIVFIAGSLTRLGYFDWPPAAIWIYLGVVVGDTAAYGIGRFAGNWADKLAGKRFSSVWQRAEDWFRQYGGLAILLSRWIFNSLDVPTSLIAGASRYEFIKYLFLVGIGRAIWIALYGGLGYFFGSQYERIWELINRYTFTAGILIAAGVAGYFLVRRVVRARKERNIS